MSEPTGMGALALAIYKRSEAGPVKELASEPITAALALAVDGRSEEGA